MTKDCYFTQYLCYSVSFRAVVDIFTVQYYFSISSTDHVTSFRFRPPKESQSCQKGIWIMNACRRKSITVIMIITSGVFHNCTVIH